MEKKGVKLFTSATAPLDNQINEWMKENPEADVVDIKLAGKDGSINALVMYTFEETE